MSPYEHRWVYLSYISLVFVYIYRRTVDRGMINFYYKMRGGGWYTLRLFAIKGRVYHHWNKNREII